MDITLSQMRSLDAVVRHKSLQAAAQAVNKTHPSVVNALKKMEQQLGFTLFDRSGYRLSLTAEGQALYKSVQRILQNVDDLYQQAQHFQSQAEAELNIVIGDITPKRPVLKLLSDFSRQYRYTRINLLFENLFGPNERLLEGDADLIIHHIDKSDTRYQYFDYCQVHVIPAAAPGFITAQQQHPLTLSDLDHYTQCIIRDSARGDSPDSYFINENAPHITVGDQHTKKEVILQGIAWGHMPEFLIQEELRDARLLPIPATVMKSHPVDIVVAKLASRPLGRVAQQLWQRLSESV